MKQKSKWIAPLVIAVVLVAMIVTAVFAAYYKETVKLNNTFEPAVSTIPEVSEKFKENDKKLKEDVRFNVGKTEYPVYVRAKIVITWQDKDGNVYYKPVEDDDYEMILSDNGDWEFNEEDEFYYCKKVIESGKYTPVLIEKCRQINEAPAEGYTLSVEIIVQTVQAIGTTDAESYEAGSPAWQDAGWEGADWQ